MENFEKLKEIYADKHISSLCLKIANGETKLNEFTSEYVSKSLNDTDIEYLMTAVVLKLVKEEDFANLIWPDYEVREKTSLEIVKAFAEKKISSLLPKKLIKTGHLYAEAQICLANECINGNINPLYIQALAFERKNKISQRMVSILRKSKSKEIADALFVLEQSFRVSNLMHK